MKANELKEKKPKCHNCKHASKQFKVFNVTNLHCYHPSYTKDGFDKGEWCAWDTLRSFYDTCEKHEFKNK